MNPISPEEMGALDANCAYFGLIPLQLMENAGSAIAREVRALSNGLTGRKIAIVAGRGNNGGDAFVAARHLHDFEVTVFLIGRAGDITTAEASANWNILHCLGYDLREVKDANEMDLSGYDLVIDALFGTGITGSVRGLEACAIEAMNTLGKYVVSVDVPSGSGTDHHVRPTLTITFHRPKIRKDGAIMDGVIRVADIGIPPMAEVYVGPGDLRFVSGRHKDSHKGDSGRVLIIGGGAYSGAPALAASAALRAGADIVTVAAPKSVSSTIAGFSPNLIVRALNEERLCSDDIPMLRDLIAQHDVVVIGMGLGRAKETHSALQELIPLCEKAVIDADALQGDLPVKGIVTPHAGEFNRISGLDLPSGQERQQMVMDFARKMDLTVLLKGRVDVISDGRILRLNSTGNPGMTVGGTGDVLAGICGSFYSRAPPLKAAAAAAFVNGRAGDLVYLEKGFGMVATDLIEKIPMAMRA